jgi:hypothetical protein
MVKARSRLFESSNDVANSMLSIGNVEDAVETLLRSGACDKAFMVAAAARNGSFKVKVGNVARTRERFERPYIETSFADARFFLEYTMASSRAKTLLVEGELYSAAASYLSIGDVASAELLLLRHGQSVAAFLIDLLVNAKIKDVRFRFAMLCIQSGVAVELFGVLDEQERMELAPAVKYANDAARKTFYAQFGLKEPGEYLEMAQKATRKERLQLLLLAGCRTDAVHFFLDFVRENLTSDFAEARTWTKIIERADLDSLSWDLAVQVISLSLYFGVYTCLWKGYAKVSHRMQSKLKAVASSVSLEWLNALVSETERAVSLMENKSCEARLYSVGYKSLNSEPLNTRYCDQTKYGKQYWLEDGKTKLSMEGALMWFDVTPFSPLNVKVRHYIV